MKKRAITLIALITVVTVIPVSNKVEVDVHVKKPQKVRTHATWEEKKANKAMAMRYAKAGWGWGKQQRACVYKLFMKESKFDHLARNQRGSSAYGIAQVLHEKSSDPAIQLLHAYRYIEHRYKTPCRAWYHHQRRNWY